jgi:hypothetical protein
MFVLINGSVSEFRLCRESRRSAKIQGAKILEYLEMRFGVFKEYKPMYLFLIYDFIHKKYENVSLLGRSI